MTSIQHDIETFQAQLRAGSLQRAYRGLLSYMQDLRSHFADRNPDFAVSGLYQGRMDMTYFAIVPPAFKQRSLKIAIVFNYAAFRFEVWLVGNNRKVQRQVWELFKDSAWPKYRVVAPAVGIDSIVECDLAEDFDLDHPEALTVHIGKTVTAFIGDLEQFLDTTSK